MWWQLRLLSIQREVSVSWERQERPTEGRQFKLGEVDEKGALERPSGPVVLNQGLFFPPGNIWQCLETFWAVTAWG